jgi:hypothetical protein
VSNDKAQDPIMPTPDLRRDAVVDQARTAPALLNSAHDQAFTRSLAAGRAQIAQLCADSKGLFT